MGQNGFPNLDYIINAHNFQKIQDCLSEASDMAMLTVDYQGTPVTRHSRCSGYCGLVRSDAVLNDLCRKCDSRGGLEAARLGKPYIYRCHMGLLDLAVPIVVDGHYTGAVLAGQVVLSDERETGDLEKIAGSPHLRIDDGLRASLEEAHALLPAMTRDRVQVIANMLFQITNYIIEEALVKINLNEAISVPAAASPAPSFAAADAARGASDYAIPASPALPAYNTLILQPALEYIKENYAKRFTLDDMASLCNISSSYFSKLFNKMTGESFSGYINLVRVERACELLTRTDTPITVIALDLGFEDNSYFDKVFKRITGVTPSFYKAVKRPRQA